MSKIPLNQASVLLIIAAGIGAGLVHVFSGPDHLAAIAPLAMKRQRGAWLAGLRWGMGHASGVIFVGILSLLLRGVLPVDLISNWSDRLVGALLIGIGFWTLRKALLIHTHAHAHEGETHEHVHVHTRTAANAHAVKRHLHTHAAFGIGTLHGLSGSSHFLAIIPALAMPSTLLAVVYLACYGVGTVLAMILFASAVNSLSMRFAGTAKVYRGFMFACSGIAVTVGCIWLFGFGF
jgi:cytochrome c biogenesis DsbD-like protein